MLNKYCHLFQAAVRSARPLRELGIAYVNGYQMIQLQKQVRNCVDCSAEAKTTYTVDILGRRVRRPTEKLNFLICEFFRIATDAISDKCVVPKLRAYLTERLTEETYTTFSCVKHDFLNIVIQRFLHFFLHTWCNSINNVLQGKDIQCNTVSATPVPACKKAVKSNTKNLSLRTVKEEAKSRFLKYRTRNRALAKEKNLKI